MTRAHARARIGVKSHFDKTISQPYVVALMTDLLDIGPDDAVLEIGTGLGYQSAIIAQLARKVYSIEIIEELGRQAKQRLRRQGCTNVELKQPAELTASECRACGACCSFSPEWPRFSLESDADLDRIPCAYVDREHGRTRCSGNRCAALVGHVGISTVCAIYAVRPDVCRACLPGDDSCKMARRRFNL